MSRDRRGFLGQNMTTARIMGESLGSAPLGFEAGLRVLIVDDEDSLRDSLYRNFESDGYEVLAASSGEDGLAICRQSSRPIALLVTDYNLPRMSGLELGRE